MAKIAAKQINIGTLADGSTITESSGSLSVGSITSANITNGTIVNVDVSNSAAIATSKLDGAVTGINNHGLAAVATSGSAADLGSGTLPLARLSDIANAHIATNAAIAGTKLDLNIDFGADIQIGNQTDNFLVAAGGLKLREEILFNEAVNGLIKPLPTAHNVIGKDLVFEGGSTTAGTTNDIAGGKLILKGGAGKGQGTGGSIQFFVATAAGSAADTLNNQDDLAMEIFQSKDINANGDLTVAGNLTVNGAQFKVDGETVVYDDTLIEMGTVGKAAPSSGGAITKDLGLLFHQWNGSAASLNFMGWDHSASKFRLATGVAETNGVLSNIGTKATLIADLDGQAASATILHTTRNIGGVAFNGSANINLPGVNQAGNQDTSGSAATLGTARAIALGGDLGGSANFDGSANITIAATIQANAVETGMLAGAAVTSAKADFKTIRFNFHADQSAVANISKVATGSIATSGGVKTIRITGYGSNSVNHPVCTDAADRGKIIVSLNGVILAMASEAADCAGGSKDGDCFLVSANGNADLDVSIDEDLISGNTDQVLIQYFAKG